MTDDAGDPWVAVARAAAESQGVKMAPKCPMPGCGQLISADGGSIKVHFSSVTSKDPCVASYATLCAECGGAIKMINSKKVHLDPLRECSSDAATRMLRVDPPTHSGSETLSPEARALLAAAKPKSPP